MTKKTQFNAHPKENKKNATQQDMHRAKARCELHSSFHFWVGRGGADTGCRSCTFLKLAPSRPCCTTAVINIHG